MSMALAAAAFSAAVRRQPSPNPENGWLLLSATMPQRGLPEHIDINQIQISDVIFHKSKKSSNKHRKTILKYRHCICVIDLSCAPIE
ncbi:hypothetical protein [Chromobacterium sphagni]|uniref:hypothetical protein n=1 Tax=Chromobacterium sphagni TaxID=1903179 RepID=UPI00111408EE|nr:hypothetical protein [Chromobacterium sphagni]